MHPIVAQHRSMPRLTAVSLLTVFERVLPHALLVEVLAPFLPATRRSRKLPAEITADTPANTRAFGKHNNQYGSSAFPLVLAVYLLECGTHAIVDAIVRPGHDNPVTLARRLTRTLTENMLVLTDRGLTVWSVLQAVQTRGAHLLGRVETDRLLVPIAGCEDGSYLARLYDPSARRTAHTPFIVVRFQRGTRASGSPPAPPGLAA